MTTVIVSNDTTRVIEVIKQGVQGVQGVQGDKGDKGDAGIYNPPQSEVINFNDLSPITLQEMPAGTVLTFATVSIIEAFDGAGAFVKIGTDLENDRFVKMSEIDIAQPGLNTVAVNQVLDQTETIKLFINAGTLATSGKVFVRIEAK